MDTETINPKICVENDFTLHILNYGLPLCQFSIECSGKWPKKHFWIGVGEKEKANCLICKCVASREQSLTPAELFIIDALGIGALELVPEGRKLKSGRVSPYFFNSGRFTTGKSLDQLAHAYIVSLTRCFDDNVEVIFGPAYKGIPLSVAIALQLNCDVGYAFNRKETKRHGEGGDVIGMDLTGKRVIIVDDVISTGESKREAVEIIRTHGGTPIGCVIAFDRQERWCETDLALSAVQDFKRLFDIPLVAVATLADLISVLKMTATGGDKNTGDSLKMILTYQAQYGISS